MQKMKQILITILAVFFLNSVQAQSHIADANYGCRLKPKSLNTEKSLCPACQSIEKKEKEAKIAEDKRRADATVAKANAEKASRQRAAELKKAEDAKNAHSGEVVINGNKQMETRGNSTKSDIGTTKWVSKKDNSSSKLFSAEKNNKEGLATSIILTELGDTISTSTQMFGQKWNEKIGKEGIPTDAIIVQYIEQKKGQNSQHYNLRSYKRYNIINSKGDELLKEERINFINYCGNDFFIYTYFPENKHGDTYGIEYYGRTSSCQPSTVAVLFDYKLNKKYYFEGGGCFGGYFDPSLKDGKLLVFSHGRQVYMVNSNREYVKN